MLTVESLLQRARERAARLRPDNPLAARLRAATAAPRHYKLDEFIVADNEEFLRRAFLKLLLRPPDDAGLAYFRARLAGGELTRFEVLHALATAEEGVGYHITVDGLAEQHCRLFRTPLLGWLRRRSGRHDRWLHLRPEAGR